MDNQRFAVVIFTMMVLFLIYLDNAGRLKAAITAAKGGTGALPTSGTIGSQGPLPVATTVADNLPYMSGAPGATGMPGTIFGAPGATDMPGTIFASAAGGWFG